MHIHATLGIERGLGSTSIIMTVHAPTYLI